MEWEKFNREEEKKEQQEKAGSTFFLKGEIGSQAEGSGTGKQ